MGICHLNLITQSLDKLCVVHSFKRTPLPLPPSLIFMASLPRYQKTYLACTISLEYSVTVKKNPKFPSILKSHWQLSLFLHRALQIIKYRKVTLLVEGNTFWSICRTLPHCCSQIFCTHISAHMYVSIDWGVCSKTFLLGAGVNPLTTTPRLCL